MPQNPDLLSIEEADELAIEILALDKAAESNTIEDALIERFNVDRKVFCDLINSVFTMMNFQVSPLTNEPYVGIATKTEWLAKKSVTGNFIGGMVQYLTEGKDPVSQESFVRTVGQNKKPWATITFSLIKEQPQAAPEPEPAPEVSQSENAGAMNVDFNNLRKQAIYAYDSLVGKLNHAILNDTEPQYALPNDCSHNTPMNLNGYVLIDAEDIQKPIDELRSLISAIASVYEPGDEKFKDVYSEVFPEESGDKMFVFNEEIEEVEAEEIKVEQQPPVISPEEDLQTKIIICNRSHTPMPLISTFKFAGAELWCPGCGATYGMFGDFLEVDRSPELEERLKSFKKKSESFLKGQSKKWTYPHKNKN